MTKSLTSLTLKGATWVGSASFIRLGLRTISVAILARLLAPNDFGVVAGAMIAAELAAMISSLGLAPTLVQRKDLQPDHVATALSFSLAISTLTAISLWIFAPSIASLLRIPEVANIVKVLALLTPLGAFSAICESLLAREMRSRSVALRPLASFLVAAFGVAVPLAYAGYGYWSLVGMHVAEAIFGVVLLGIASRNALTLPKFSAWAFRDLWPMSMGFILNQPFVYLVGNVDKFLIGRLLGAETLGIYTRASFITTTSVGLFAHVARLSIFPAMAKVQNEQDRLRNALLKSLFLVAQLALPGGAFCALFANEIVGILLGTQWNMAVAPFAILSMIMYPQLLHKVAGTSILAIGRVYLLLSAQIFGAAATIVAVLLTYDFGLSLICLALVVARTAMAALTLMITSWVFGITIRETIMIHLLPAVTTTFVCVVSILIKYALPDSQIMAVGLGGTATLIAIIIVLLLAKRLNNLTPIRFSW